MITNSMKQAAKSNYKQQMGAVITKGERILASGFNELRYTSYIPTKREFPNALHAEQSAIMKLLKKNKLQDLIGSTIHVSRILKSGKSGMAKPCIECMCLIKSVGIKKVVYTTNTGVESFKV